jgi:hypothetical protein
VAANIPFLIVQGVDWPVQLQLWADPAATIPLNLTGCAVALEVRPWPGNTTVLLSLSTAADTITITNPTQGMLSWDVPAVQTAAFAKTPGVCVPSLFPPYACGFGAYDLFVTWPSGQITQEAFGPVGLQLTNFEA